MNTAQETAQVRSLQKLVLKLAFALGFDGATLKRLIAIIPVQMELILVIFTLSLNTLRLVT